MTTARAARPTRTLTVVAVARDGSSVDFNVNSPAGAGRYTATRRTADVVEVSKFGGGLYLVSGEHCTCPDRTYRSGKVCKHAAAVAKLVALGKLS